MVEKGKPFSCSSKCGFLQAAKDEMNYQVPHEPPNSLHGIQKPWFGACSSRLKGTLSDTLMTGNGEVSTPL